MNVPFLDLRAHHAPIRQAISAAVDEVIDSNSFSGGPYVQRFEEAFAKYCGTDHAVGVGNGTDALWLTLLALGIGPGDEVITTPNTFIATAEAISLCGAKPVFIDIDETTHTMDPALIEGAVSPATKAVIPVHLYGQPADMDPIVSVARRHGLFVIEDACQAHGAEYQGRPAGSLGDVACFSFYPSKNLGAMGEGGAVVTADPNLADRLRLLRDHGQSRKYCHEVVGCNARMDGFQGAILNVKLSRLDECNEARRTVAESYRNLMGDLPGIILPLEAPGRRHVYHLYVVRVQDREGFMAHLARENIGCSIHYPVPIHLQKAYAGMGLGPGSFPKSEAVASEVVSLPMFPEMTSEQTEAVAGVVKTWLDGR